jgi:hypothetical protein
MDGKTLSEGSLSPQSRRRDNMDDSIVGQEMYYVANPNATSITTAEDYDSYITKVRIIEKANLSYFIAGKASRKCKLKVMNLNNKHATWTINQDNEDRLWSTKIDAYMRLKKDVEQYIKEYEAMLEQLDIVNMNLKGCITKETS